jgi:peptidoglycan glycosyltransferase
MNAAILRLYGLIVVLFALLIAFTSRWTVFEADAVRDQPRNARPILEELRIKRGVIRAADGTVLARSVPGPGGTWERRYPEGGLFAFPVGYSNASLGQRSGIEKERNDELTGRRDAVRSFVDQIRGKERVGDDVTLSLEPAAQRAAYAGLNGRRGSVVALDPRTGAIKAMASNPTFDPDRPFSGGSQFNRATQSGYPPGSTFKVVTDVAAIDSGRFTPDSVLDGRSPKIVSGTPLANDGGESFGLIDLTTALTNSVNTVWARVAEAVGKRAMGDYMKRYGFYAKPPLDYPADQRRASGEFKGNRLLDPESDEIDVGRMGIGQDKLAVTPLQMAQVAAAVANGGVLMAPHLAARVVDPDGRTVNTIEPKKIGRVMKPQTAATVNRMMQQVVREGTGTAAALSGIDVAGKTGTAEVRCGGAATTQTWFIAFAPADDPKVAVAATVECSGGFGGTVAAPISKSVMQAVLHG